jgi:hypothetical protein
MNGLGRDRRHHAAAANPFVDTPPLFIYIKYAPARCKTHALINGIIFIIKVIIIIIAIVLSSSSSLLKLFKYYYIAAV